MKCRLTYSSHDDLSARKQSGLVGGNAKANDQFGVIQLEGFNDGGRN